MRTDKSIIRAICAREFKKSDGYEEPQMQSSEIDFEQTPFDPNMKFYLWGIAFGLKPVEIIENERIGKSFKESVSKYGGGYLPDYVFVISKSEREGMFIWAYKLTKRQLKFFYRNR